MKVSKSLNEVEKTRVTTVPAGTYFVGLPSSDPIAIVYGLMIPGQGMSKLTVGPAEVVIENDLGSRRGKPDA